MLFVRRLVARPPERALEPASASTEARSDVFSRLTGDAELPDDAQSPAFWLAFLLSALGLAFKAPDSLHLPQFWAEDAVVFFGEQRDHAWPLLFEPYGTYLHALPRLVAWAATRSSAVSAPTVYCFAAWLVGALGLVSLRQLRLAGLPYWVLLASIVIAPTNGELFGTITNAQWLTQFYFFGSLARLARGQVARWPWLRCAIALLVGLSGPFSIFAAPIGVLLVVGSWSANRLRLSQTAPIRWNSELTAIVVAALAQVGAIALSPGSNIDGAGPPTLAGALDVLRYVQVHAFVTELVSPQLFGLLCLTLLLLPLLWMRGSTERYVLLSAYGLVAMQVAAVLRKFAGQSFHLQVFEHGDRYYLIVKTLLFWLMALAVFRLADRSKQLQHALLVVMVLLPLPRTWPVLQRPTLPDLHWKEQAAALDEGKAAVIPISPRPWELRIDEAGKKPQPVSVHVGEAAKNPEARSR